MTTMKFVVALAMVLGGAMVGMERSAEANSPSSGGNFDDACLERCLNNFCSSRGLNCNAHRMPLGLFPQAQAACAPQCRRP